jgi:hypothetical protein
MATFTGSVPANVVTQNPTTGGLEVGGVAIGNTVYVDTWVELQAIPKTAANDNLTVYCKEQGVNGSYWIYRHSLGYWVNPNPVLMYSGVFGTIAAPTVSVGAGITAGTKFNVGTAPTFPAAMLSANARFSVRAGINRNNANATCVCKIYFGTAGTSSDSPINAITMAATDLSTLQPSPNVLFNASASIMATNAAAFGGSTSAANAFVVQTTNINRAAAQYISVYTEAKNTADIINLLYLNVILDAA